MKTSYEHIVIGVGGMGSAATYWLSRTAGKEVLGLEQFEHCHSNGGSQDHSRIIRRAYHMPEYTQLIEFAYPAWREVEQEAGEQVLFKTGSLNFGTPGSDAENYIRSMEIQKIPHEVMDAAGVMKRWPQFKLPANAIAAYQEDGGFVDPGRATAMHARLARAQGATILEQTPVRAIRPRNGRVEVVTDEATFEAGKVVITSGAWTNRVLESVGRTLPLTVTQEQVTYFDTPHKEDFMPDRFPVWISHDELQRCFYGFPVYGEPGTKAAQDAGGEVVTAETRSFEPNPDNFKRLMNFMEKHLPSALGPVIYTKTCLYTMPPDRHFIIDRLPEIPEVAVCIGAGHMFKFATLVGKILSEISLQGQTAHPIGLFTLDRPAITDPSHPKCFNM